VPQTNEQTVLELRGVLDYVTYHNEDSGFTIARFIREDTGEPITVVGTISARNVGETLEIRGQWTKHERYGNQFRVIEYRPVLPTSAEGIKRYLGSGLIKGLGPVTAERIVATFGDQTLDVIDTHPERLREVERLGPKRVRQIREAWEEQRGVRDVVIFLQQHGIGTSQSHRIWRQYGGDSVAIVRHNPYRLAEDIRGIGFRTADQIAQKVGIANDDPRRLAAGLAYVVSRATEQGHTYLPVDTLTDNAVENLGVDAEIVTKALEDVVQSGNLIRRTGADATERIFLPEYDEAEREIAERLVALLQARRAESAASEQSAEAIIAKIEARTRVEYAPKQREAILAALVEGVLVMTGGPGTGKTTTVRGIIGELTRRRTSLALCAPTGRAAKRLSEVTGVEARTIHRMLGWQPERGAFQHDADFPLPEDALLVDEASMIDTMLFRDVLRALKPGARLVLVGDSDQLPSVGPGEVLRNIIDSGVVPVVRLDTVFRQASESHIITNAHRINRGVIPSLKNERDGDFFFLSEDDPEAAANLIVDLVQRRLPDGYGVDPVRDIQVLAPMYRGDTGANELNARLQDALNPNGQAITRGQHQFRVGDKVIVTRNNYQKNVFNGDIGRIVGVDTDEGKLMIDMNIGGEGALHVTYDFDELDELTLAYAISVHRSQGSEFPFVVMPITTQHYMMLQRNVVYTAVTRAKRLMVLVGSKRALALAVKNVVVADRFTALTERLRGAANT